MKVTETLYVAERAAWRAWLAAHHATKKDIWLVYYRAETGQPRIAYNDAVEEALCFGWIDSTAKGLDAERFAQRFTPRRSGSPFSQPNKERLRRLAAQGLVQPDVLAAHGAALTEKFVMPPDILEALQANERAWTHFQRFADAYQRIRVAHIEAARDQPAVFEKRLAHFLRKTEQGRQFGHGIETYY